MKKLLPVLAISIGLSAIAQNPVSPAQGFNVFLQKHARLSTNETDGPMAMGGNLLLAGSYQVATNHSGNFTIGGVKIGLLVGGKVQYNSGNLLQINQNAYIKIGDSTGSYVWYRDQNNAASPIRITNGANYNGTPRIQLQANAVQLGVSAVNNPVFQSGIIDFSSAFYALKINSASLSVCSNNAKLTDANGHSIGCNNLPKQVKITLSNGVNVLNLNGYDLNNVDVFTYNQQPSATKILVINVDAPGTFNWKVWNQAGIGITQCPYIIYNFYNTTTLNINGSSTIEGTILAPYADIVKTVNQANIEGQVIGQSFYHAGGEVHFAPFAGVVSGCAQPTVASFTTDNRDQCLYNNRFEFTSTATGTAPLTYFWDFGDGTYSSLSNPVKTYALAGTYTVKHRVNGLAGADSTIQVVTVGDAPVVGFTVNDSIQELTGNQFEYTTINPQPGNSYEWRYGDGSTYGVTQDVIKTYQAAGVYFVCQIVTNTLGCSDTATTWVVVASDSVGSGNGGGLESESLGGLVGARDFRRYRLNTPRIVNYTESPVFIAPKQQIFTKKSAALTLEDMIPLSLEPGDVLRVTTPTDLVNITSALEVLSVDYVKNDKAKAVVLGIKTKNKAYSHTKYVCDRLRGATLISIDSVLIKGFSFVRYVLQQDDGTLEFGTSFALGKTDGQNGYRLQTNWLLAEMVGEDTLFNFQVWSALPTYTDKLIGDIIDKVTSADGITQINTVHIPQLYITKGYRKGGKLILHVRNNGQTVNADLSMEERLNEQAMLTQINRLMTIEPTQDKVVEVVVNDGYEYSANLMAGASVSDVVYMADGNWGLDYDRNYTTVTRYTTSNEPTRIYNPSELSVYRYAAVSAISDDYILMFKGIRQGNALANLTGYKSITFFAKGNGKLVVTIPRDSIVRWKRQYYTTIDLTEDGKMYTIPLSDFKSDSSSAPFNPVDVRMVSFSRGYQGPDPIDNMEVAIGGIAFTPASSGILNQTKETVNVSVLPNPNDGRFEVNFRSEKQEQLTITISDLLGRQVFKGYVNSVAGANSIEISVPEDAKGRGLLLLSMESKTVKYGTVKIVVNQ